MDKHTLKNLICGKLWIWKVWDTVNVNYHERPAEFFLGSGEDQGFSFVALEFTKDGKVDFPTKIGFVPPEFIYWNFNEE
ncbi:hypothetical protein [Pediococcus acidilactici]|nr:hypothetical protein [Pediococcus acidilactici]